MKINPKLILIEIIISFVLFLAALFSIVSFTNFVRVGDLRIKTAKLRDTASRLKFSVIGMTAGEGPTSFLTLEYRLKVELMDENLVNIENDRIFRLLPDDVKSSFSELREKWSADKEFITIEEINRNLNLRSRVSSTPSASLGALLYLSSERRNLTPELLDELAYANFTLRTLETRIWILEVILEKTVAEVLNAANRYHLTRLILAIGVPGLVLFLVFIGILLIGSDLSRKIKKLSAALVNVVGGDFSVRVNMEDKDEFGSLATGINAFTQTLGAKIESFRLIMRDIGQALDTGIESSQVEETLLRLAIRYTVADGAALYKVGSESGELILSLTEGRYRPPFPVTYLPDSPEEDDIEALVRSQIIQPGRTILGESAMQGEAKMIRNVPESDNLAWVRGEDHPLFLASIIVAPLQVGSTVFGVLATTSSEPGRYFSDLEFVNMQSFAELAAITLENIYKYADLLEVNQLNRELSIAEEIQRDLLPKRLPRFPGGEVAYLSRSIKGFNSDYFDVYPLGDGKTMLAICEVAGRGVPAGLVMVMIRTILRLVSSSESDAQSIMTRLNHDMTRRIAIENYASVGILVLDSDGAFSFSSAAHHPVRILRSDTQEYESIESEGIPVGVDEKAVYRQETGVLGPEDLVLFHTDGIPESRNRDGRLFGIDKLLEIVGKRSKNKPEQIIEVIRAEIEFFERGTDQKDDQTVIILKYRGEDAA